MVRVNTAAHGTANGIKSPFYAEKAATANSGNGKLTHNYRLMLYRVLTSISSPCEARKGRKPRDVYRSDKQPRRYYNLPPAFCQSDRIHGKVFSMNPKYEKLAFAGVLVALGIVLPFAGSHGLGIAGTVLLPMHIPVFICGLVCGGALGAACGFILPILSSLLTGMPAVYPMMVIMSFELMTYGAVSGFLYSRTKLGKIRFGVYPAMIAAMICGRAVYALVFRILLSISGQLRALTAWGAFVTGLPGITVQLLLIPPAAVALRRFAVRDRGRKNALLSALNLISEDTAACVVIKGGVIVRTEYGRGIEPMMKLYESGILKDAFVVDKIVGKAAAMIMTLGGVKSCYGITVSRSAEKWLKKSGIPLEYENLIDSIRNRTGDGICPMEQTVAEIENADDALCALKDKIKELNSAKRRIQNDL